MFRFLFFLLAFYSTTTYAQKPSQAEINKRMKEAKAMQEQLKNDPAYGPMIKDAMEKTDEEETAIFSTRAPKKDITRISKISPKILSKSELIQWSKNFYNLILQKLTPSQKATFLSAIDKCENNPVKLEDASILNWISKSPQAALLFSLKATHSGEDDPMYWNNLAAILNMTGHEEKAIPVLRYLEAAYPGCGMIYNNLGQAYLGLGEITRAKQYLDSSLKYIPTHPEANHSMGLIYRFMGNTIKSNYHFEKETIVCIRKPVIETLKKARTEEQLFKIVRLRWPEPENYFVKLRLDKFKVPKLPTSVDESNKLYKAHVDFRKNVQDEIKKWASVDQNLGKKLTASTAHEKDIYKDVLDDVLLPYLEKQKEKKISSWMDQEQSPGNVTYPTPGSIGSKSGQLRTKTYMEDLARIKDLHRMEDSVNFAAQQAELKASPLQYESINHKYEKLKIQVAIKYCEQEIALADNFLAANASHQPNGFEERITAFPALINEAMFFTSLAPDDVNATFQAHNLIIVYLTYLDAYSNMTVIAATKENGATGIPHIHCDLQQLRAEEYALAQTIYIELPCALKLSVPLAIAKVTLDCKKIKVEGGEGLLGEVEYEFKSGNTTLGIGAGVKLNVPFVDLSAKQMGYVTFDRNGEYVDAAMKWEASGTVSALNSDKSNFGTGAEAKASYTVSVNSGASFKTEAGFKYTTPK